MTVIAYGTNVKDLASYVECYQPDKLSEVVKRVALDAKLVIIN